LDDAIEAAILKVVEPSAIAAAIEADAQEAARRDEGSETWKQCAIPPIAPSDNTTRPIPPIVWWRAELELRWKPGIDTRQRDGGAHCRSR